MIASAQISSPLRLLELSAGMPVNALFYSQDYDLIYARTADEREGYVPRDHCKPVVMLLEVEEGAKSSDFNDDDSIKYHSLSSNTDYENLETDSNSGNAVGGGGEVNPYAAIVGCGVASSDFSFCPVRVVDSDTRDSGYRSDMEAASAVNDYEVAGGDEGVVASDLERMQSRSRVPISISNSSDLTVMSEKKVRLEINLFFCGVFWN